MLQEPLSEQLWRDNMLKGQKDCSNLHSSSFVIFFYKSERTSLWKKNFFVVSQILRLFVNIYTPDDT